MRSFAVLSLILLLSSCQAFAPQPSSCGRQSSSRAFAVSSSPRSRGALCASSSLSQSSTALFSSPESENDKETTKNDESTAVPETDLLTPVKIEEESDVPLDIPSPLLLASSIILAIVSTGCLFDLLGGNPTYGFAPSAGVAVVGFPLCIFLFLSAIAKGQKETEEDDKNFRNTGGF